MGIVSVFLERAINGFLAFFISTSPFYETDGRTQLNSTLKRARE
jgi:hypothetical protein